MHFPEPHLSTLLIHRYVRPRQIDLGEIWTIGGIPVEDQRIVGYLPAAPACWVPAVGHCACGAGHGTELDGGSRSGWQD